VLKTFQIFPSLSYLCN